MTAADKLTTVRAMTDQQFEPPIVQIYLDIAERKVIQRAYPYDTTANKVPDRYAMLQCEIAVYMLNRRGSEGQTAHSEPGVSRSYESADIPESLLSHIVPMVGVIR